MACLHGLVIGVSHYPHSTDPVLRSIAGPAISAARFAEWLRTRWNHPGVTLGSLEVLLSPIDDEAATALTVAGEVAGPADAEHVKLAVSEWAKRCDVSTEDIALLYVAGHGTESLYGGGVLLLEDYDEPGSGALGNALDLDHVRKAIGTKRAYADFIFVDACRFTTDAQFDAADASPLKPIKWKREDATLRTHLKVFYGAAPDQSSYTLPEATVLEHGTMFCKALMAGVDGGAVDLDDDGGFCVSANRLLEAIARGVESEAGASNEVYARKIRATTEGVGTFMDVPFHWPESIPVTIRIELDPAGAAGEAEAALLKLRKASVATHHCNVTLVPHPSELTVESGKYRLRLNNVPQPPARFDQENDFVVMPSATHWKVEVHYVGE